MKLGIIQSRVSTDKEQNLSNAIKMIEQVASQEADIVILSEMFNCPYSNEYFATFAEGENGATWETMSNVAKANQIYLVAGSIPTKKDGKIYNTSFVFDRLGQQIACYKKAHLFDIDIVGGQKFFESDTFTRGDSIITFETEFGIMGLCICFDFRFPELSRIMTLEGAKIIIVPGAFNMTTGPAHWEILFRQRAVDNQVYTVGVAPARNNQGYISYGNSIVVSPWGDVIYRADEKEIAAIVEIDMNRVEEVRSQLPLLSARRTDLYELKRKV